jgi:hypothetical protein
MNTKQKFTTEPTENTERGFYLPDFPPKVIPRSKENAFNAERTNRGARGAEKQEKQEKQDHFILS